MGNHPITEPSPDFSEYHFEYDDFGRTTCIKVGNQPLIITAYDSYGRPTIQTYGNSQFLTKSYDTLDRVTEIKYNNDANKSIQFYYSNSGNLTIVIDHFSGTKTRYIYDLAGRVVDTRIYKTTDLSGYNNLENWVKYYYDASTGYVTGVHHWAPEIGDRQYTYRYGNKDNGEMPDQVYGVSLNGVEKQSYSFDNLGRLTSKIVNVSAGQNITYSYAYKDVGDNGTTTVVETFMNDMGTYVYEYDGNGNIKKETFTVWGSATPTKITVYGYDKLGQLTLVTINGQDRYAYYYDASGNLLLKETLDANGENHKPYGYAYGNGNWRDQLTSYCGEPIRYDEIGNPLTYRGATLTWQNGRQLTRYHKGSTIVDYKYDGNGNRISKSYNGNTYEFIYNGSNLVAMTNSGTTLFNWICDENGDYLGFTYCGVEYYYVRNLQNDVIAIKNQSGKIVVGYEYDPFGKVIATTGVLADTLGKLNPIRYRGYFYDTETGFYFLKSRYYDPETCRFINADGQLNTSLGVLGVNQFSYCLNDPTNMLDYGGNKPGDLFDTMDEAAKDFAEYINEKSIEDNLEYASYIYTKTVTETVTTTYVVPNNKGNNFILQLWNMIFGKTQTKTVTTEVKVTKYTYREPKQGTADGSSPPINWFGIHMKVGLLHTHAAYDSRYANDVFSIDDISIAKKQDIPIYVATPLGTLRKYDPVSGEDIILYTDIPFDKNHPGR